MENKDSVSLPQHYEHHLGEIARGWSDKKQTHGIQVVSFNRQPEVGVTTFATLGLSRYVLRLSGERSIRQELLVSANEMFLGSAIAGFVLSLAEHIVQSGKALLRGEVIGPATPVISGSTLTAVYVTNPSPFDQSLTEFDSGSEPVSIVFAYLIPITSTEAMLVQKYGWSWFEEQLEKQNPDIWNLERLEEIVLSEVRPD